MSNITSIIVYRNPLEAMIWESLMNGGAGPFLAVFLIALVGVGTYALIDRSYGRHWRRHRAWGTSTASPVGVWLYNHNGKISIGVSLVLAIVLHLWYIS